MADIFVSYTAADRDWAFWISKELQALGHVARVHEWEIKSGGDIYAWMEARHDAADHVLCVVSDEYLRAPFSTLERNAAIWQAASQRPGFVLFTIVKPCRLPTLTDHIRRCELFGIDEDAARVRFREFMQKREAPKAVAFPGKVFAVSNIPIRVPAHFLGREDALAAIEAALARHEALAIAALHGLRGAGKTTLAAAYAERRRGDYRATWWIRAQTESTMRADLMGLGVRLGWVAADDKEDTALAAVAERLRQEGEGILLIFDNASDPTALGSYLPRGGHARVLVTSNAHTWRRIAEPIELRLWPQEVGADYLIARTGRSTERAAAEALSDALAGLPLAHEQAAAYCERLNISLGEYARRFKTEPARFMDDARHAPAEYHDGLTVAKTFGLAIEEASSVHPAAEPLIVHAALLAPEPIPIFLFAEARNKFVAPLAQALEGEGLEEALAALRAFALIDMETIVDERDPGVTTDCIRLHRLVRQVAAARREGELRETVRIGLIEAVAAAYPSASLRDPGRWPRVRRLDALALGLVGGDPVPGAEKETAALLDFVGGYRYFVGDYSQARPLYERALSLREKTLGCEHHQTAASLNHLAQVLHSQGDLAGARPLCERALAISEKTLGPEHPQTAESLGNLAALLRAEGDLGGARRLYERSLAIWEKALGPEHPDVGANLNNLALLLQDQGKLAEARPLYQRALAINEKALGPEHPETAVTLNNLGSLLRDEGNLAEAHPLYERVVVTLNNVLGPEHPKTNRARRNFATLLLVMHDPEKALSLGEPALASHDKLLGRDHPWTKDSASVTADALDSLDRAAEAMAIRARYGLANKGKSA